MDRLRCIALYTRHISFICYLIAIIVLFPSFDNLKFGNVYLIISFIYIITSFFMFFIKSENEEKNILNNCVLSFFHIYICLIAYKYNLAFNYIIGDYSNYFNMNFILISICSILLITNRIIIANSK